MNETDEQKVNTIKAYKITFLILTIIFAILTLVAQGIKNYQMSQEIEKNEYHTDPFDNFEQDGTNINRARLISAPPKKDKKE